MIIRENFIYFFLFLFGYGLLGAGISVNNKFEFIYLIIPIFFFFLSSILNKKNEVLFIFKKNLLIDLKISDFIYFSIIFFFLFILVFDKINLSISDDEYAYANLGLIHSNFIIGKISENLLIENIKIKHFYHLFSFIIILGLLIYFYFLKILFKNNKFWQIFILILTVLILRYVIFLSGGNQFPHPPLIGLPALFTTSLFGLSDFGIKFFSFISYVFLSFYFFIRLKKLEKKFISFLITISIFSIPGILYLSSSVEQSLFSMICFSIVGIELSLNKKPNYKKIMIIILFFSFFRILSILSLVLVAFHFLIHSSSLKQFFYNSLQIIKNSYPLLLIVPFIIFSFTTNTDLTVSRVSFDFFNFDFFIKTLPLTIINGFTFTPGIILLFIILLIFFNFKKNFFIIFFLLISLIVYGNVIISPYSKYLYEIFFPLILSFVFLNFISIKNPWYKKMFLVLFVTIGLSNILILKKFNTICLNDNEPFKENLNYNVKYGCNIIANKPFNIKNSYKLLKEQDQFSFERLYVPGVYYGILPSIINDMKIFEYKKHKKVNSNQNYLNVKNNIDWTSGDAKNINSDPDINFVLISNLKNSKKLTKELIKTGWSKINEDIDKNFKTTSIILIKNK